MNITQDPSLPVPVEVDPVSSPTSAPSVTLTGSTEPSSDVDITGGAADVSVMSDASGAFSALVANARNELRVTRRDSSVDTIVVIVHDDIAPDAPSLNTLPSPTNRTTLDVSGTTEPRARVSVTGAVSPVATVAGDDGRFTASVSIEAETTTTLSVTATDRAVNTSAPATASVTHSSSSPDAPNVDDTNPPPTNQPTHTVTGNVPAPGAGVMIRIAGGASTAMGAADPTTGEFAVEVTLAANAANELSVTSLDGELESPPSIVSIVHDDIAPADPAASSITASAGTGLGVCIGGSVAGASAAVEANAMVFVWHQTAGQSEPASPSTTATETGAFSAGLTSCGGDLIRVRVRDAAGNRSSFVEVAAE